MNIAYTSKSLLYIIERSYAYVLYHPLIYAPSCTLLSIAIAYTYVFYQPPIYRV